jgi:hypothetical protein
MSKTRVIVTKYRTYELAADAQGVPVEEYWPDIKMTDWLKGAKVYQTQDGSVVAMPSRQAVRNPRLSKKPQP